MGRSMRARLQQNQESQYTRSYRLTFCRNQALTQTESSATDSVNRATTGAQTSMARQAHCMRNALRPLERRSSIPASRRVIPPRNAEAQTIQMTGKGKIYTPLTNQLNFPMT